MLKEIDFSDSSTVGPSVRGMAPGVLDAIQDLLAVLEFLETLDTTDPSTGGDPLRPARERGVARAVTGLAFLESCWATDDAARELLLETFTEAHPPGEEPWDEVNREIDLVRETPHADERMVGIGRGALSWSEPEHARDIWGLRLGGLREIGAGYAEYAQLDSATDWYPIGQQATRLCLSAADPVLAHFAALRVISSARAAGRSAPDAVGKIYNQFWSESAPKVTDRGFEEQREFGLWISTKDPRRLVDAHGSLLEAVGRPLLTALLAIHDAGSAESGSIDVSNPLPLSGLLERLASIEDEPLFDLIVRAAKKEVRNARGHEGVTRRAGNVVEIEDVLGNAQEVDLGSLEFDHLMLRSLLVGVEAGLALIPAVMDGFSPAAGPLIRHTVTSFEVALRRALHRFGLGAIDSLEWTDEGHGLTLRTSRHIDPKTLRQALLQVLSMARPETVPSEITFLPPTSARGSKSRKRRKTKARGRRDRRHQ